MRTRKSKNYQQLIEFARNGFLDPFKDLGTFDCRTLTFEEPVEVLENKYSGSPYTPFWQAKIQEMREVYTAYQRELKAGREPKTERVGYIRDEQERTSFNEKVQLYLSLGFSFSEVAEAVGYSEKTLRNSFRRSEWNQMNDLVFYDKEELKNGKMIQRSEIPLEKLKEKSCCLTFK